MTRVLLTWAGHGSVRCRSAWSGGSLEWPVGWSGWPGWSVEWSVRLDEIENSALAAGIVNQEAVDRWRANLEGANKKGCFFASATLILVVAKKRKEASVARSSRRSK